MSARMLVCSLVVLFSMTSFAAGSEESKPAPRFAFGGEKGEQFLLDGRPFQIRGGEMHPSRIPPEYWRHRVRMAKAMGLNTISVYVFWNDHERAEGMFDFASAGRDIGAFLKIAKEEGVWVLFRPGPYCCGEWDFGGIPTYLLRYPDLKLRTMEDRRYTAAVERYLRALAAIVRPNMIGAGGPILMVQIENEYGSYQRRDRRYMEWLRELWVKEGVPGPFYTADGADENCLKDVVLPGVAVGLDPGLNEEHWNIARKMNPGVPVFSSETYPGWLRHWGEGDWQPTDVSGPLKFYMETGKSFCLYMFHGGTNFGFTAGANNGGPGGYQPDLTSYDYGSPVDEQGRPTPAYHKYRELIASYLPKDETLPDVPEPIPAMTIPEITMERWTSLWERLPAAIETEWPETFESQGQNQGMALYQTTLPAGSKGKLAFDGLHDYALVFLDGKLLGTLDRCKGQREIDVPDVGNRPATLDVLVEGMGHINFHIAMEQDRKGIVGGVKLGDASLENWRMFLFPLNDLVGVMLPKSDSKTAPDSRPGGTFFKGTFELSTTADTFFDLSKYEKGVVWVNGRNLGRFWKIGPQQRLYCPASWLKTGPNEIVVLDLHATDPRPVAGRETAR